MRKTNCTVGVLWSDWLCGGSKYHNKPRFILACQWQQERTHRPTNKPHIIKALAKREVLFAATYKTTIWHQEQSW